MPVGWFSKNKQEQAGKAAGQPTKNASSASASCPQVKVTLVELIEVVTRSPEGAVVGAAPASAKLKTTTTRTEKHGSAYKQYINLKKDVEGARKRHPEFGRYIEVKARVECKGGPPSGRTVTFRYKLTPGAHRPAALTAAPAEGFLTAGGAAVHTATADKAGWTETVKFYLSQYAGDQFTIMAEATEDHGNVKCTQSYEVWRRFWYQLTRAKSHHVPQPEKAIAAYKKLFADMLPTHEVTFVAADTPANTFYPGWMLKIGGGEAQESVIGAHNKTHFYKSFVAEAHRPVKGHLIICQNQWDPDDESDLLTVEINKNPSDELSLVIAGGDWNAGILKPALQGSLVSTGRWSAHGHSGHLTSANILIEKGRSGLNTVKVKLPSGAPNPAKTPVKVQLKLKYGKFFGGESHDNQMLIVYDGADLDYQQAVSHEFGHGFGQTPKTPLKPLPAHKGQYTGHGGVGSHCNTDATLKKPDKKDESKDYYEDGTCIMFHQLNPTGCKQVFCDICEPYMRLQDFSTLSS